MLFMLMGLKNVSKLLLRTGLLFISQVISEYGELRWNYNDRGTSKNWDTCRNVILSITNATWTDTGVNSGFSDKKLATNRLSHGTVQFLSS
jgi:hypothetical protein